jgi:Flp pilus assembly protein TadB
VSKQRQLARAQRQQAAAKTAAARRAAADRAAAVKARSERRDLAWRRLRLWQHGPSFRRDRERWGALATLVLLILLLVYLVSRSVGDVLITALALLICAPVLVLLFLDRRRR